MFREKLNAEARRAREDRGEKQEWQLLQFSNPSLTPKRKAPDRALILRDPPAILRTSALGFWFALRTPFWGT